MKIHASYFAAALAFAFAPAANATLVGSTYDFTSSVTGTTTINPLGGPTTHTDPAANAGFCVGPNGDNCATSGLFGAVSFSNLTPTTDRITFSFSGSTGRATGSFVIDLGNFHTLDGEVIEAVSYFSGNLGRGDFTSVSFNGTDAIFTGTPGVNNYNASGGFNVLFNVTTSGPSVPEPASLALLASALLGFGVMRRRRSRG